MNEKKQLGKTNLITKENVKLILQMERCSW